MTVRNWTYSGTLDAALSERESAHSRLARELATEGIVLLKNENLLPLKADTRMALLGSGCEYTVKGGIGSGDVNNRENISIYRGIKEAGILLTSEQWIIDYENRYETARNAWREKVLADARHVENPFDAYAANPFALPEGRNVAAKDIDSAEVAVYVVSRISGEGKDRRRVEGDYFLSKTEREDLLYLDEQGIPVVLVINAGGPVELTELLEHTTHIRAILNISQLGQQGGYAVADVLLGKSMPTGRLTATWAKHYEDYPYSEEYSYLNGDLEQEKYQEDIYVGYRYFESFGVEPLFPFGYGLSYTTFAMNFADLYVSETGLDVDITVKNIGDCYAGREVVQIYVSPPQTDSAREYHRLVGFAKTAVLPPGEEQKVRINIEQKQLASFCEAQHAWIMEAGEYVIWVGSNSVELEQAAVLRISKQTILERTHAICQVHTEFEQLGVSEYAKEKYKKSTAQAMKKSIPVYNFEPKTEKKRICKLPYATEQSVEELIPLLYGNITQGASTLGSAGIRVPGSAGETTEALEDIYGIRSLIMADGPAGLRLRQSYEVDSKSGQVYGLGVLDALENGILEEKVQHEDADVYYQYCTAFPVGTAMAQTWDIDLMKKFGKAIAVEMEEFHVNLWLAPGMNIHRNPLCGRNFEYFSEDPLLTGMMAAAVTVGVQSRKGCGVTIKHFACNNQEDNRMGVDVCVSEKALREIYFRGFEIAIKHSDPAALMTSYNLINGVHSANSGDLCTTLAREEWGFNGMIMTDWNTTVPEGGSTPWKCAAVGNDIIMPGNPQDDRDIREAYRQGKLSEAVIRRCAGRVIDTVRKLTDGM